MRLLSAIWLEFHLDQEHYTESEQLLQRVLEILENSTGPEDASITATLNTLAEVYSAQEDFDRAEALLKRSQAILEAAGAEGQLNLAATLDMLGRLYANQQRYAEAEPFFERSLERAEQSLGGNHPFVAEILGHYAELLRETNRKHASRFTGGPR